MFVCAVYNWILFYFLVLHFQGQQSLRSCLLACEIVLDISVAENCFVTISFNLVGHAAHRRQSAPGLAAQAPALTPSAAILSNQESFRTSPECRFTHARHQCSTLSTPNSFPWKSWPQVYWCRRRRVAWMLLRHCIPSWKIFYCA